MKNAIAALLLVLLVCPSAFAEDNGAREKKLAGASVHALKDPQLAAGLAAFEKAVSGGINLDDIPATREFFKDMTAENAAKAPPITGVSSGDHLALGPPGAPKVKVRIYQPEERPGTLPALLWIHGGGYVIGDVDMDDLWAKRMALALNAVIASVEYRLAPEHPYPAPLEDCYAALKWLIASADRFGIDVDRVAIGGASAGGGLAAGLGLLVRDRSEVSICYQLLIYPMLDDANVEQAGPNVKDTPLWSRANNLAGWSAYLQQTPGSEDIPIYAAPARATDLRGLPATFIGVGTPDLFRDENMAYAQRLMNDAVPTELHIYADGFHAFDVFAPDADATQRFVAEYTRHIRRALHDK